MKKKVKVYLPKAENGMEPQGQMPQGQPQQPQQGQPQQGGQNSQMQQIMQFVQQAMQQGAQPGEVAAKLLEQRVPPEAIMQIFVQMGMPQQEAQAAIQEAIDGFQQQQQGPGEEQMEGQASNPQEEQAEQGMPPPEQGGQPTPGEEIQMRYGGRMPRKLKRYDNGGETDELTTVMQQIQEMLQNGSDPREVMKQIQAAAQQGQITPETATAVMEQLGAMQSQGSDPLALAENNTPQPQGPPEQGMMKFGGMFKQLLTKAYGGQAVAPGIDSKTYAEDRANMFVGAVKNNLYKNTLDDEFPSLSSARMAYGGIPKAAGGINLKEGKIVIDPSQYKTQDEYDLAMFRWNADPANKDQQITEELKTANVWKAPAPTYEKGKNYQYDETTKQWTQQKPPGYQFSEGDVIGQDAQGSYVTRKDGTMQRLPGAVNNMNQYQNNQLNPVGYQNPMNQGLYGNLYSGARPFARFMAGSGNYNADPRIIGNNLPGGMSGQDFYNQMGSNGMFPNMTGTVGDQTWRIGEGEKFKEGSIWKGNRRKGVRYTIDWGNAAAMNPVPVNPAAAANNAVGNTGPAYQGFNADSNGNTIPDYLEPGVMPGSKSGATVNNAAPVNAATVNGAPSPKLTDQEALVYFQNEYGDEIGDEFDDAANLEMDKLVSTGLTKEEIDAKMKDLFRQRNDGITASENPEVKFDNQDPNQELINQKNMGSNSIFLGAGSKPVDPSRPIVDEEIIDETKGIVDVTNISPTGGIRGVQDGVLVSEEYQPTRRERRLERRDDRQARQNEKQIRQDIKGAPQGTITSETSSFRPSGPTAWQSSPTPTNRSDARDAASRRVNARYDKISGDANWYQDKELNQLLGDYTQKETIDELSKRLTLENPMPMGNGKKRQRAYGGGITQESLSNAINLINRAFGGMIPIADNGLDLGPSDGAAVMGANGQQLTGTGANMTWNQIPVKQQGTIEDSSATKFNINWDAAADMYANGAPKATNFFNKARAYDPERDAAKGSSLNSPSNEYAAMQQGLYDQAGNFIPNDIGNQVLNPSDSNFANQRQVFSYGGRLYEVGGDVDLSDDEYEELLAAGFNFSRT